MKTGLVYKINLLCDNILKLSEVKKKYLLDIKEQKLITVYLEDLKYMILEELEVIYNEK